MTDNTRSRSNGDGMMQPDTYCHETPQKASASDYEFRCCRASSYSHFHSCCANALFCNNFTNNSYMPKSNMEFKFKKGMNSASSKLWSFGDPEFKRKKRVAVVLKVRW
ncbi:hypothetical protein HRI_003168100 [Hibiscus trionum]|uniref:Uncharacterized protein n=1 Tax=Hibiscus trionum TaxID=183268 RepID=A0A9W7IIU0_HIBTR|nr:hypothetical protein HRI_003168100 [Hibiscus trionum]